MTIFVLFKDLKKKEKVNTTIKENEGFHQNTKYSSYIKKHIFDFNIYMGRMNRTASEENQHCKL